MSSQPRRRDVAGYEVKARQRGCPKPRNSAAQRTDLDGAVSLPPLAGGRGSTDPSLKNGLNSNPSRDASSVSLLRVTKLEKKGGRGAHAALDGPRSAFRSRSSSSKASLDKRGAQSVPSFGEEMKSGKWSRCMSRPLTQPTLLGQKAEGQRSGACCQLRASLTLPPPAALIPVDDPGDKAWPASS